MHLARNDIDKLILRAFPKANRDLGEEFVKYLSVIIYFFEIGLVRGRERVSLSMIRQERNN